MSCTAPLVPMQFKGCKPRYCMLDSFSHRCVGPRCTRRPFLLKKSVPMTSFLYTARRLLSSLPTSVGMLRCCAFGMKEAVGWWCDHEVFLYSVSLSAEKRTNCPQSPSFVKRNLAQSTPYFASNGSWSFWELSAPFCEQSSPTGSSLPLLLTHFSENGSFRRPPVFGHLFQPLLHETRFLEVRIWKYCEKKQRNLPFPTTPGSAEFHNHSVSLRNECLSIPSRLPSTRIRLPPTRIISALRHRKQQV